MGIGNYFIAIKEEQIIKIVKDKWTRWADVGLNLTKVVRKEMSNFAQIKDLLAIENVVIGREAIWDNWKSPGYFGKDS